MHQPINGAALDRLESKASTPPPQTDGTPAGAGRTAIDLAHQLERDAASLSLTGSAFNDKAFHDAVAADLREAASWLKSWPPLIRDLAKVEDTRRQSAVGEAYAECAGIACEIHDVVAERSADGRAAAWRAASEAIHQAILASSTREAQP